MKKLADMSIDELEESLSTVSDPTSASPTEAVLQSKSIRFLSSEIAVFKEAINNNVLNLNGTIGLTNKSIKELRDTVKNSVDQMIESNRKLVQSQQKYQWWLCLLTLGLIIATLTQAYVIYWTTKPERTIEQIAVLNKWSESQKQLSQNQQ